MRRLTAVVPVIAVCLMLAPGACAKGIKEVTACGANGCRVVTPKHHDDLGVLEGGAPVAPPDRKAPYFEVKATMLIPEGNGPPPVLRLVWVPSLHLVRTSSQPAAWTSTTPRSEAALRRAVAGLEPRPAAGLDLSTRSASLPEARVVEVVPAPTDPPDSGDASQLAWAGAALGGLLLAGGAWLLLRRRRAGPDPHPIA
jgi:LPXTG-motif cell wall-anchored protein